VAPVLKAYADAAEALMKVHGVDGTLEILAQAKRLARVRNVETAQDIFRIGTVLVEEGGFNATVGHHLVVAALLAGAEE
jgi:hypothetical protein